jgi:hypothetical protein
VISTGTFQERDRVASIIVHESSHFLNGPNETGGRRKVAFPPRLEQSADLAGMVDRNTF